VDVETIKIGAIIFRSNTIFPTGARKNSGLMTDARILSNNCVTCEANRVKCETLMQDSWAYKSSYHFRNRSKGSPLPGDCLPKSGNFCHLGPRSHSRPLIGMKFCRTKWTHVPLGCVKFHVNRCNESPLRGENADFRPMSIFKYRLMPLRGVLPVNNIKEKPNGSRE